MTLLHRHKHQPHIVNEHLKTCRPQDSILCAQRNSRISNIGFIYTVIHETYFYEQ